MRKSEVAVIVDIDRATSALTGWSPSDMVGRPSLEFIHPDDQELAVGNWMTMLSVPGPSRTVRLRHKCRDGSWVWVDLTNVNHLDDPDVPFVTAEMAAVAHDGDAQDPAVGATAGAARVEGPKQPLRLHEALRAREQVLHRLAEALPLGVVQLDGDGRIVYANHMLGEILGSLRAVRWEDQLTAATPSDRDALGDAFGAALDDGLDADLEVSLLSKEPDKELVRRCMISVRALKADDGAATGAVACVSDITESARIREELRTRATIDTVTQCHNRASTMDVLQEALSAADEVRKPALIYVDLDRFKVINDHLGHAAGDEMLAVVGKRLQRAVRAEDLVGRIGGDEFLIVCPGIAAPEQAMQVAHRVAGCLGHSIRLKAAGVPCHASIGVAWANGPSEDPDAVISRADAAMYEAKRAGRGRPVFLGSP